MLFDDLGIYGWDSVEPIIMTALLADLPILLIGDIGTNKTEGAKTIAEGALGRPIEFRHYEVPTLNFDDLIGFLNPKTLTNGTLKFIPTPISIWKAEGVLFDEINRANPFIQSKLHEVVRTRKVMGLPTNIKVVFAAVNPPGTYQTGYMDLAIASRFVSVQVPNIKGMKDAEVDRIIGKNGGPKVQPKSIHDALAKARGTKIARKDMQKTSDLVKRVARDLAETEIIFNPRQLRMMFKMVMAGEALNRTIGTSPFSGTEVNSGYIGSVIPEIQGIVRSKVDREMVMGVIRTVVGGFSLGDPIITANSLEALAQAEIGDPLAWVTAMKKLTDKEDNPEALTKVIQRVRELTRKGVIDHELGNNLIEEMVINLTTQSLLTEDIPVTRLLDRVSQVIQTI
jgi:MoxR-like ATPase